jgi:hypothetical protein
MAEAGIRAEPHGNARIPGAVPFLWRSLIFTADLKA